MAGLEDFDDYEMLYRGRKCKDHRGNPTPNDPTVPDPTVTKYVVLGCGLAGLITENLLIHPFIVLRRQCQVNPGAIKYHIMPFTLVPVVIRLYKVQGLNTLWKGIGSVLLLRGIVMAVEDLISKITAWPKELPTRPHKGFLQHILLKCISTGLVTPFYSVSLAETVQCEFASEVPGTFDIFWNGIVRLTEVNNKGRQISIYALLPATIAVSVTKDLFIVIMKRFASHVLHNKHIDQQKTRGAWSRDSMWDPATQNIELQSVLLSQYMAEVVFYPMETVMQRLHLQGTRTIIDNLDTGQSLVTPLLTGYDGVQDCYNTIISMEGPLGLYKGFGALVMQFAVHLMIMRATKWVLTTVSSVYHGVTQRPSVDGNRGGHTDYRPHSYRPSYCP